MFDRIKAVITEAREMWAYWQTLPRKPKAKGWGALGGMSNEQIDERLAEGYELFADEDLHCAEPES